MLLINEVLPYLIERLDQIIASHLKCEPKEAEEKLAQKILRQEEGDHARVPVKYVHDAVSPEVSVLTQQMGSMNLATFAASSSVPSSQQSAAPSLLGAQPSGEVKADAPSLQPPTLPSPAPAPSTQNGSGQTSSGGGHNGKRKAKGGDASPAAPIEGSSLKVAAPEGGFKESPKESKPAPASQGGAPALSVSAPAQVKESKEISKLDEINEKWLKLPNELISFSSSTVLGAFNALDNTHLTFGCTWGELALADFGKFKAHLHNGLKDKEYPFNKMLILNRFKRQLLLFREYAKKVLEEREKALQKDPSKYKFADSIDHLLGELVRSGVAEAKDLIREAKINAKASFVSINFDRGPGETELALTACEEATKQFVEFCTIFTKTDKKGIYHANSMLDMLPSVRMLPLGVIFQRAARYLAENLYDVGYYHAFKKLELALPCSWYAYDEKTAKNKREHIFKILNFVIDTSTTKEKGTQEYWENLLEWMDQGYMQANQGASLLSTIRAYTPGFAADRCPKVWQDAHKVLLSQIPPGPLREAVEAKHRDCKL